MSRDIKKNKFKVKRKKRKSMMITIVGIGYVGLPLACLCGEKGYKTFGISKDRKKINQINNGISPIKGDIYLEKMISRKFFTATSSYDSISKSDIIIICVPTPVDERYNPDLTPVKQSCRNIAKHLKKGQLIIIESTVNPGVCEEVVKPLLEEATGLQAGKDFYLAHCPERINPGDPHWNVRNIPRCVGALSRQGLLKSLKFYRHILEGEVRPMKSIKEAEATKIIENSFRDINIAFVNELAKSFEVLGIDLMDVIEGASTKPFAFMAHYPSCGVGGHCIPVDPYYLIERAKLAGFDHRFLKLAREINNSMPSYTVDLLIKSLNDLKKSIRGTKVGLLGMAYKANVADMRESPAVDIMKILKKQGAMVEVFDPYLPDQSTVKNLEELLKKSEALIIATDHNEFKQLSLSLLKKNGIKVVIDGKNCLNNKLIKKSKIIYKGVGR
ncbi:nucleotide sugar dehydrogenase [Patescibacteria group bacterium]|nr:nucleotide sugar dehydrogenase [Patescibacteria group bacterium]MBU0963418.1 nucleotide sugar dehydrogenase [Patescibacteria group bacterium]